MVQVALEPGARVTVVAVVAAPPVQTQSEAVQPGAPGPVSDRV